MHLQYKIGDCDHSGQWYLSPLVTGLGVSLLRARWFALFGSFSELLMIPAQIWIMGERRWLSWSWTACSSMGSTAVRLRRHLTCAILAFSSLISETSESEDKTIAKVGVVTSITLSARLANSCKVIDSAVDAKTSLMFVGRRWRNSSRINDGSSPAALSPSSSVLKSCCKRRCSDAAVLWTKASFKAVKGSSSGGEKMRYRTSVAYSGESSYDVVELGLWDSNIPGGKLCLYLGKPKERIGGPERRDL